ncbi:lysozyme inhibitor LprI family protein [Rheinheimera sp. MMS21-TC3]|uniref:lysozyme inhibitor LprI family protein n=1 Tax=Rheinheimera sp. MMS21-TC3 TaxID=3072790 RepID=UPI0028C46C63|nr:lysozyme inhibitor LprI family protein [Rheinheimera sp. MMS21-TC3]WNO61042.1 lysozyme inhibitor LprI family protein [Rheinheimera sp. MMS21-TC3]
MKFKWKVAVGFLLLGALAGGAVTYWQQDKAPTTKRRLAIEAPVFTPEVDCSNAVTDAEKLICADEILKQLDAELAVAYHNDLLWQLHAAKFAINPELEIQHGCIKQQREQCQQRIEATQRQWAADSRDQCKTADCLVAAYKSRIAQINGQSEPLPNFRLSTNRRPEMCEAMLEVLNRTSRQQLGACNEFDFSNTPFSRVANDAGPDLQMQFVQYQHADSRNRDVPFEQHWPDIEQQYHSGLKKLFAVQIDADGDGQNEWLLEFNEPHYVCKVLPGVSVEERKSQVPGSYYEWSELNKEERLEHGNRHGRYSSMTLLKDGKIYSVEGGRLIQYQNELLVLRQGLMMGIIDSKVKNWIELDYIPKKPFSENYWYSHSYCQYWYNY